MSVMRIFTGSSIIGVVANFQHLDHSKIFCELLRFYQDSTTQQIFGGRNSLTRKYFKRSTFDAIEYCKSLAIALLLGLKYENKHLHPYETDVTFPQ